MSETNTSRERAFDLDFVNANFLGALPIAMGIRVTEMSAERMVAIMPVEGNTQPLGLVHGGAYVVLGESLGSVHANYLAPEGTVAVGVDVNATHTGAVSTGTVTAICRPVHVGKSLAVHEIIVTSDDDRRCSTVRITNFFKQSSSRE